VLVVAVVALEEMQITTLGSRARLVAILRLAL
jgi:hypothetical protein